MWNVYVQPSVTPDPCTFSWNRMADRYVLARKELQAIASAALDPLPALRPAAAYDDLLALMSALRDLAPGTGWRPARCGWECESVCCPTCSGLSKHRKF